MKTIRKHLNHFFISAILLITIGKSMAEDTFRASVNTSIQTVTPDASSNFKIKITKNRIPGDRTMSVQETAIDLSPTRSLSYSLCYLTILLLGFVVLIKFKV